MWVMHWFCYPDMGRDLGCDLMLHLTRILPLKSAAIPFPYQLSVSPSPASLSPTQGKLGQETDLLEDIFHLSFPSCQISSVNWLAPAQQLNALPCWRALAQVILSFPCLLPWEVCWEGCSSVSTNQGKERGGFCGVNGSSVVKLC